MPDPDPGLANGAALLGVLTATIVEFNKVSPDASYLMLPYLGWTVFATVLTIDIYRKNPGVSPSCWALTLEAGVCRSASTLRTPSPKVVRHWETL